MLAKLWRSDEDDILRQNRFTPVKLINQLLPDRGYYAISQRRRTLGLTVPDRNRRWQGWEDNLIVRHYPNFKLLLSKLPGRTKRGIRYRATVFGLCRPSKRWTAGEVNRFNQLWLSGHNMDEIARELGRSIGSVLHARDQLGVPNPSPPADETRLFPVIVDLRHRALSVGAPYTQVGEEAGRRRMLYRRPIDNHAAVARAVRNLGGELYAEWED